MRSDFNIFENITDIFAFYDRPVLFVSEINKVKYICELINETEEHEEWLVSDIQDQSYEALKALEIDFYTCFKNSKSGKSKILNVSGSIIKCTSELPSSQLADNILPLKDVFIKEKTKKPTFILKL